MDSWTITDPEELTLENVRSLKAFVTRGSLRVVGTETGPARLKVSEIDEVPLTVRYDRDVGTLQVTHDQPGPLQMGLSALSRKRRRQAVVSLALPPGCEVGLSTATAQVVACALTGPVSVFAGDSVITLAELSGDVDVTDVNGQVEAMMVSGSLTFKSVSADLAIADLTGALTAETTSGTITVEAAPPTGTQLRIASVGGGVTVGVPSLENTRVHLESTFGRVSTQFPELEENNTVRLSIAKDVFGSGRTQIWVKTVSGDITLIRRNPAEGAEETA